MTAVFISHAYVDAGAAAALHDELEALGFGPVFTSSHPTDGLWPGAAWEREIFGAIQRCRVLLFLGSRASLDSRWCFAEIMLARSQGKPILSALIEPCSLPVLVSDRQAVAPASDGGLDVRRIARGLEALGLDPRSAELRRGNFDLYPGLRPFEEQHAAVFLGRSAETDAALDALYQLHRCGGGWLLLIGGSGVGKTSLLNAGLVARLRADPDGWEVVGPLQPNAWEARREPASAAVDRGAVPVLVVDALEQALLGTASRGSSPAGGDPLEDLRRSLGLTTRPAVGVVTLRTDFLPDVRERGWLRTARTRIQEVLAPDVDALRTMIEEPARRCSIVLDPRVVEAILHEAAGVNALPMIALMMHRLWSKTRGDGCMEWRHYVEVGGLHGVLTRAGRDAVAELRLSPAALSSARALLTSLVQASENRLTGRAVAIEELPVGTSEVRELLIRHGLLVLREAPHLRLELAHEVLLTAWEHLAQWCHEVRELLEWRTTISTYYQHWRRSHERSDALLPACFREQVLELLSRPEHERHGLSGGELRFLERSAAEWREQRRALDLRHQQEVDEANDFFTRRRKR